MNHNKKINTIPLDLIIGELHEKFENGLENEVIIETGNCTKCTFYITKVLKIDGMYSVEVWEKTKAKKRQITNVPEIKLYPYKTSMQEILGNYCSCHSFK